ncbi:hypothetical protein ACJ72_07005, partial [Emergomyces africanus]
MDLQSRLVKKSHSSLPMALGELDQQLWNGAERSQEIESLQQIQLWKKARPPSSCPSPSLTENGSTLGLKSSVPDPRLFLA